MSELSVLKEKMSMLMIVRRRSSRSSVRTPTLGDFSIIEITIFKKKCKETMFFLNSTLRAPSESPKIAPNTAFQSGQSGGSYNITACCTHNFVPKT